MWLRVTTYPALAVLLLALACDRTGDDPPDLRACERAVAPLPSVDPQRPIRPNLERYLTDYASGWSIGDGADGLSMTLPSGCGDLADRIEAHYGNAIHVDRDVDIRPLK